MAEALNVESLVQAVQDNRKYARIAPDLIDHLCREAIRRGLRGKAAVKSVRNKLHQVGGAYIKSSADFSHAIENLNLLPVDLESPEVRQFCLNQMRVHASTAERIPILEDFFQTCLAPIGKIRSVLDLACGLNPLAIPWMPLAAEFSYQACDIYLDMLDLIRAFLTHFDIKGQSFPCDLVSGPPEDQAQVAFLLKTIPCLEQLDKDIGTILLERIHAENILVSFPAKSLGGRNKGMPDFYRSHFYDLLKDKPWTVREFSFPTEIAFLISK
jgi:16S rRNA (guanine(1405)-N(7))-methyltransferase